MFRSLAVTAGLAGLLLGMGAPVAQAKAPIEVNHFNVTFDDTFSDCGLDLYGSTTVQGTDTIRPAPGSNQAFLSANQVRGVDTLYLDAGEGKNPSGDFVTVAFHARFLEQKATLVTGSVYTFRQVENGQFTMRSSDGTRLLRGNYHVKITLVFDTLGDGVPGGIELSSAEVVHENASGDFCDTLVAVLT